MKRITSFFLLIFYLSTAYSQPKAIDFTAKKIERYKQEAKTKPIFIPLEIGDITPKGWILEWATTAANGITGHLDEYNDVYKHGWKGFGFKARGVNEDGTGWPLEQCSYWLDGGVKLAYILKDTMLIRKTSERLNMVVNGVLKGGETFIYWKPYAIVNDAFNNWGHGLMGRALVSYYQATHDPKILEALVKVYKKFPLQNDVDESMAFNRGTTNIDAMTETFLMSGNKSIHDSIVAYSKRKVWIDGIYSWNHLDKDKEYNGHGVSFYEILRVPSMMYSWTGNTEELKATENALNWGERKSLLPEGVCSSEEYLAGRGSIRCVETCNIPTSMWSFLWILRVTGDSKWSDKIENVFFNAGPVPAARDFKTMSYYHSSNRFSSKLPGVVPVPGEGDMDYTDHGHNVLCCVGNINNTIPDYISNMWMATMDNGLAATLYGPCSVSKKINNTHLTIDCKSSYPFEDKIEMKMKLSQNIEMPLYLRIPEWCKKSIITINGKTIIVKPENGFAKISRIWKNNDAITLTFPMNIKVQQERENPYPQTDYFLKGAFGCEKQPIAQNKTVNNPYQYVSYGPLLFSLPIADINENQVSSGAKYNYALDINPKQLSKDIQVVKKPMPNQWSWQITQAPILLQVKAKEINWEPSQTQPLPNTPVSDGKATTITLIPYGCTKFRMTMFPITKETYRLK
jgi:uncharacterized protein